MSAIGYGESYPVASNGTSSGRQQNRRVDVLLKANAGPLRSR
jgi:outer membrane protein OmpA-like peptidoglycan-associated protein